MKIDRLWITKFRSIKQACISCGATTAVVGANNAGKSALLRSLNAFFHPGDESAHFVSGSHGYSKNSLARIEIAFSELPRATALTDNAHQGVLRLRATWKAKARTPTYDICKQGVYTPVDDALLTAVRKYVDFVLIPPHRDPSRFREEERALLWQVTDQYLARATRNRDTISTKFRAAATYLESHQLEAIGRDLSATYASPDDVKFRITLGESLSYRDFVRGVEIKVSEGESEFALENCGTGVQSQAIIALHRMLARLEKRNIVIGIEEPETNLHPQAQQRFVRDLADSIQSDSQETQCVLTTHSTVVVDALSHEDIVLVRKVDDSDRGFRSELTKLESGFWTRHGLDEMRYQKYHQYRNSDFFYSKLVLVVESTTDADVLRRLFLRDNIDLEREGVAILSLDGGRNLAYAHHLLAEIGLPSVIVLDKDHFIPYLKDERSQSLDASGKPVYRQEFKANSMIEDLVPNAAVRQQLLPALMSNHTKALNLLEPYGVVSMRWALEVDLVASEKGREAMFAFLNIPVASRTEKVLLVDNYKRIKKPDVLINVIDKLPLRSLPFSFLRVRKIVQDRLSGAAE